MLSLILLIAASISQRSIADNILGNLGGILEYDETYGFPTRIPIEFQTDFAANDQIDAIQEEVYFTYDVSGSAASYYSSHSLVIQSTGPPSGQLEIVFVPDFLTQTPKIGFYQLVVGIDMFYKNVAGDILMHMKTYAIDITLKGLEGSYLLGTSATIADHTQEVDSSQTHSDYATSAQPEDLVLEQAGNGNEPVAYGEDIVLHAGTIDTNYRVWLDTSNPIGVYDDPQMTNIIYEWPLGLVGDDTATTEEEATNLLVVRLTIVPVELYYLGSIYVKLTIQFRDTEGDLLRTRELFLLDDENIRESDPSSLGQALLSDSVRSKEGVLDRFNDTTTQKPVAKECSSEVVFDSVLKTSKRPPATDFMTRLSSESLITTALPWILLAAIVVLGLYCCCIYKTFAPVQNRYNNMHDVTKAIAEAEEESTWKGDDAYEEDLSSQRCHVYNYIDPLSTTDIIIEHSC